MPISHITGFVHFSKSLASLIFVWVLSGAEVLTDYAVRKLLDRKLRMVIRCQKHPEMMHMLHTRLFATGRFMQPMYLSIWQLYLLHTSAARWMTAYMSGQCLQVYLSLYAVGLKGNVSEAEHPLLCEGTRRQKGELAVAMLVQYKDDPAKLKRVCISSCEL